jgi:uncharacterized membrane protein
VADSGNSPTVDADLVVVAGAAIVGAAATVAPPTAGTPIAVVLGLPLVLFWPGYAVVSALYPERDAFGEEKTGGLERLTLSLGLSLATSPTVALVIDRTLLDIEPGPVFAVLAAITLGAVVAAALRRGALPPANRYRPPVGVQAARRAIHSRIAAGDGRPTVVAVIVVVALLVSAGALASLAANPRPGEQATEFYLLTQDGTGDYVAAGYPMTLDSRDSNSLVVGITNRDHRTVNYTVVVTLQRVRGVTGSEGNVTVADSPVTVTEQTELRRFDGVRLAHGEEWSRQHTLAPNGSFTGTRIRLAYLLYRGTPPTEPTLDNAVREVHLWVRVPESG